jgi:cephalosporin hydroxylase
MSEYHKFKTQCAAEIAILASDPDIAAASRAWIDLVNPLRYSYHFEWMGRPIIQYPQDIVAVQELIWQVKPDLIIETGVAHGGSLILSASMLALIDLSETIEQGTALDPRKSKRKVIGIDIDIRAHNRAAILGHPMARYIEIIEGSAVAPDVVARVRTVAEKYERILVFLDSMHSHEHVLGELEAYAQLVSVGSYCVVFDTIIEDLPADSFPDRPWSRGDNPKTAVWAYVNTHPEFVIDKSIDSKLLITVAPDGFLRRCK